MIGIDTNVVLALLLDRSKPAAPGDGPFRVSLVVLAELAWVLRQTMKRPREELIATMTGLLEASDIRIEHPEIVQRAIEDFADGAADFPDYLLMRDNERDGCATTLTLDRKAARHPGFTLIPTSGA